MLEVFLGQKINEEEGQRQTHPILVKRDFPTADVCGPQTGRQLVLGGEDESEQNKYHQCTQEF